MCVSDLFGGGSAKEANVPLVHPLAAVQGWAADGFNS